MRKRNLKIGDLVTHVLYGGDWIGVIVSFKEDKGAKNYKRNRKALVQIQPGSEYENFFKRSSNTDRINDNLGYICVHWLFKAKVKNANT